MSVLNRLEEDLTRFPDEVRNSTLAEGARALASSMDASDSLRDLAMALKELRATMGDLETRASQAPSEVDPIDRISDGGESATVVPISSRRSG